MSLASTLLRVLLMVSLLCNGLGAAVAGIPGGSTAVVESERSSATAGCHGHGMPTAQTHAAGLQAPADDDSCRIKECLRSCAQHPALVLQPLLLPSGPALSLMPQPMPDHRLPAPLLPRLYRPPIG